MDPETTTGTGGTPRTGEAAGTEEAAADQKRERRTFVEEIEVSGGQLVTRVKELFQDANAKRVIIRSSDGDELMTIPLTVGVVAGGILTLAAPLLAALGALAALVTRVRLEVIREGDPDVTGASGDDAEPPA